MSLAQCCEDQLIPINLSVWNQADSKGEFPLQRFLPFLRRSHPGTGSANNQPLGQSKAWNTSRGCLGWWRKDPLVVLLPAAAGTGCKLFLHLSQQFYIYLEQLWCPGALPLSSLCSTGSAVSPLHKYLLGIKRSSEHKSCGGWLQRGELLRVILLGFVHFLLNENSWPRCNHWFEIWIRRCWENWNLYPWMLKTVISKIGTSRPIIIMLFLEFWGRWQ